MQAFRRPTQQALRRACDSRRYASSGYASTNKNLRITHETKVLYQGFTGKQGSYVVPIYGVDER